MPGTNLITRTPRFLYKQLTFTGAADLGAQDDAITMATLTGYVLVEWLALFCTETLTGASAAVNLGAVGNATGFVSATTATDCVTGDTILTADSYAGMKATLGGYSVMGNIILTPTTADITGGSVAMAVYWLPFSPDGNLA